MKPNKRHFQTLQGKVFKILPLFEQKNDGLTTYISSLIYELEGLQKRLNDKQSSMLMTVLSILGHLHDDSLKPEVDISTVRREVFHCRDVLKKMSLV